MLYSPEKHGTVADFEAGDAYRQFRDEMHVTLDYLKTFAVKHTPYDAQDVEERVSKFDERLFNLEQNYYSDARVAFYGEGKRAFDLLYRLLQNDDIAPHLRTSAMLNVVKELGVCGPGMIVKIITEVNRLCNGNGGLLAASWQLKHDIIEQLITNYVREHCRYRPSNEVHVVWAFMIHGAERLGISPPSDRFAPKAVDPAQLEECMKLVGDFVSPSRLALEMADRYLQIYLARLTEETKIAPVQLTRGVEYDDVIVETANRIVRELAPTYGADTVKECSSSILVFDDTGGNEIVRVPTDPTLLARDILRAQHEAGLVDAGYKEDELVLSWSDVDTGLTFEIRHNDESLVWATVAGQVESLAVEHLTQFSKQELEALQTQRPKLMAALARVMFEREEPAEALTTLPPQWLAPEYCPRFLSKLNNEQAIAYLKANGSALTREQHHAFATALVEQQRLPLLDHSDQAYDYVADHVVKFTPQQRLTLARHALDAGNSQVLGLSKPSTPEVAHAMSVALTKGLANAAYRYSPDFAGVTLFIDLFSDFANSQSQKLKFRPQFIDIAKRLLAMHGYLACDRGLQDWVEKYCNDAKNVAAVGLSDASVLAETLRMEANGVSGLRAAVEKNHVGCIEVLVEGIVKASVKSGGYLSEQQVEALLNDTPNTGQLHAALRKNADAEKAYVEALVRSSESRGGSLGAGSLARLLEGISTRA
ncbi:hypothetical protein WL48_31035 [Burkholderia ubonensis]|uniref:hypothetical protein n=1 Tax=Burkholderia ubonensis TaxID=101571 RepID=UPI00075D0A13|nr:hypothetical protein [Burkholderia ubonensis]KWC24489.1 hypothetical protein WL48_31035 [Burkholderia ubonensis]KWC34677.1 hypothetical protein WL49_22490 [Burkholderia ubonensis]